MVSALSQAVMGFGYYLGSGFSQRAHMGMAGIHLALYFGLEVITAYLLDCGADVEEKDNSDRTPLSWAAEEGHEAVVKLLLENGANAKAKDSLDWTPLSLAAEEGHEAMVKLLLERAADIEAKDSQFGQTHLS